jgi:hypothetical protein
MEVICSSKKSTFEPYGAITHKMAKCMTTAVRTSNPTWIERVHSGWWIANGNFSVCNSTAGCIEQQTFWTWLRIGRSYCTSEIDDWVCHLINKPGIQFQRQSVSQCVEARERSLICYLLSMSVCQSVSLSFQWVCR